MPDDFEVELWRIVVPLLPPPKDVQARRLLESTPLTPQEQIEHERRARARDEQAKRRAASDVRQPVVSGWVVDPSCAEGEVTIQVRVLGGHVELDEPDLPIETLNRHAWNRIQERYGQPVTLRVDQGMPVVTLGDELPVPGQRAERYGSRPAQGHENAPSGFRGVLAPSDAAAGRRPRSGSAEVEHDEVPPLCARLLAELSRHNDPTALPDLPEPVRQEAVLSGCERRGLAVGVVWYEGAPGSSGVLPGGAPYVAVGTSAGWYPSAGLTHRPAPTHFAITPKGKAWLEEEQLRADPHVEKLRAAAEAVGEYERRYQEGLERVSRAVQSVPPFAETMKEAYLEALAEHGQRTAADPPKALPAPTGDAKPQEQPPLRSDSEPVDPIPLTWLREQVPASKVKGDASKLAAWLTRRHIPVYKVAGKNYAERADLLRVFKAGSRVHELITEYNGDGE